MLNNIDQILANAPELQADEGLDAMPCSASDLLERWEERIRNTPERAKSGGVDYVGGLLDAYGSCLHELREFLEQNMITMEHHFTVEERWHPAEPPISQQNTLL